MMYYNYYLPILNYKLYKHNHLSNLYSTDSRNMYTELELLTRWKSISDNYKHLHEESYSYFFRLNNGLMIPIIALSTCSGGINVIFSFQETTWYIQLITGIFGFSVAMLSSVYNFLNVPEYQEKHDMYSVHFDQLSRTIDMELVLYASKSKTYASLPEFIKIVKTNMDRLIENAPPIPKHILDKLMINSTIDTTIYPTNSYKRRTTFEKDVFGTPYTLPSNEHSIYPPSTLAIPTELSTSFPLTSTSSESQSKYRNSLDISGSDTSFDLDISENIKQCELMKKNNMFNKPTQFTIESSNISIAIPDVSNDIRKCETLKKSFDLAKIRPRKNSRIELRNAILDSLDDSSTSPSSPST